MTERMLVDALRWCCCPRTKSVPVQAEDGSLISSVSGYRYPVRHGIPDFRLFDPPYVGRGAEAEIVNQIVDASSSMAYDELLEHFEYHTVQLFQLPL